MDNTSMPMVDLLGQYRKIKSEIDSAVQEVLDSGSFIGGAVVNRFTTHLADYHGGCHVITCGNGTDALQIALMALGMQPGDEVIVPAFTYVASAEVIGLLRLIPVLVDVDPNTFNVTADTIAPALSPRTRAVIPVHLFGQSCDMEPILQLAEKHSLAVIEDNAQAIGAEYTFGDGHRMFTGTMGTIGCTSFFPSKNLGCYGDGGALLTRDTQLADHLRMIANHGQREKYHHDVIGCNSRLDALQAAILDVKLRHLDEYIAARRHAADYYDANLQGLPLLTTPARLTSSTHVFHQYTLRIGGDLRDALRAHLATLGIPSMVYYPLPLQQQRAFHSISRQAEDLTVATALASEVLSLPMHTELTQSQQDRVIESIRDFFNKH